MRFNLAALLGFCALPLAVSAQLSAVQTYDTPLNELSDLGLGTDSEILVILYDPQSTKHQQQLDKAFNPAFVDYFNNSVAVRLVDKNSEEGKAFARKHSDTKINVLDKSAPTFYLFHSSATLYAVTQDAFAEDNLKKFAQTVRFYEELVDATSELIMQGAASTADIKQNIADIKQIGGIEAEGKINKLTPFLLQSYKGEDKYSKDYLNSLSTYDRRYASAAWQGLIKDRAAYEKKLGKEPVSQAIQKVWYLFLKQCKEEGTLEKEDNLQKLANICGNQIPELYDFSNAVISYWQYEAAKTKGAEYEKFKLDLFNNHAIDMEDIANEAQIWADDDNASDEELKRVLTWLEKGEKWNISPYAVTESLCIKSKILLRLGKTKEAKAAAQQNIAQSYDKENACGNELLQTIKGE